MPARIVLALMAAIVALTLSGCGSPSSPSSDRPAQTPTPTSTPSDPAAGLRLAPGLYDQADGSVLALGTLEHRDLEGGFWAVVDGTVAADGTTGSVVAVISNGSELESTLKPLSGKSVEVKGQRIGGASVRMAGPEIRADEVREVTDTPGIAE